MSGAAVAVEGLKGVDKIWHLRQAPLLKGFSLPDLTAIARICSDRIYSKGEVIFSEEDVADSICILNRGCVRISVVNAASGREKIIALFKTGDIFGENILGNPRKRSVQATAHDECWVSVLSRDHFLRLLSLKPGLALNMIEILTHQLTEAREDIGALSFLDTRTGLPRCSSSSPTVMASARLRINAWSSSRFPFPTISWLA